ncbi:hypothetical protein BC833DRAFT_576604 [Globomyces pollinis-pini]|nr:hypothetical protein BC833DRAFT_576604 [Globomyces pollinis-pini]
MAHVLITGASGGVGVNCAYHFIQKGYKVTLHYNSNPSTLLPLLKQYPGQVVLTQASVTNEQQVMDVFGQAISRFGPVEILIVCHGVWPSDDVLVKDMEYSRWKSTMAINLNGTFLFIKHYCQQLDKFKTSIENPSIVLIGSTAGKFGEAFHTDYSCSKTAMMYGMISSLKNELVKIHKKARINTVAPGWIRTPMAERAMNDPQLLYQALASTPLRKVSEPEDITKAIMFLADSTLSGNITGVCLDVNGGMEGRLLNSLNDFNKANL